MGGLAESQLRAAMDALMKRDVEGAERVMARDPELDECERNIEAGALSIIARRQPMAIDLRYVFGNVKDRRLARAHRRFSAKNIAKRTLILAHHPSTPIPAEMGPLGATAMRSLREVMDSLHYARRPEGRTGMAARSGDRRSGRARDGAMLISSMSQNLIAKRKESEIESSTHLLFITKNLERVGDHATNIAGKVIEFQLSGAWKTRERPKGGDSLQKSVRRAEFSLYAARRVSFFSKSGASSGPRRRSPG